MLEWMGSLLSKIIAVLVGGFAVFNATSTPILPVSPTPTPTSTEPQMVTSSEIEDLRQLLEQEKIARLKLEAQLSSGAKKPIIQPPATAPAAQSSAKQIKTFTMPSGAVIDENGNVISSPVAQGSTDSGLSTAQISGTLTPSVVLLGPMDSAGHITGTGSGVAINDGRFILTNAHVVGNSSFIAIKTDDGDVFTGTVKGSNHFADLAIVYTGGKKIPPAKFGKSDAISLPIGSEVYAFGYPLTLLGNVTVTRGIISARQKFDGITHLQTDANIHHGNSGGPLVNKYGEIIGINSSVLKDQNYNTQAAGIGFAIPIDYAQTLIPGLIEGSPSVYGSQVTQTATQNGSLTIPRSIITSIEYNPDLQCSQFGLTVADAAICDKYKNQRNSYSWTIDESR